MNDLPTTPKRRPDGFLSSRGIDQSSVLLVGGILVLAFILLSLIGTEPLNPPVTESEEPAETLQPAGNSTDIAGAVGSSTEIAARRD